MKTEILGRRVWPEDHCLYPQAVRARRMKKARMPPATGPMGLVL